MNDRLVSDTGPLIALATIDRLDILPALFHQILIPEEVHREILQGGETPLGLQSYRRATWIQQHPLQTPPDQLLAAVLDSGEAAVIQLARESQADYLLLENDRFAFKSSISRLLPRENREKSAHNRDIFVCKISLL